MVVGVDSEGRVKGPSISHEEESTHEQDGVNDGSLSAVQHVQTCHQSVPVILFPKITILCNWSCHL